MQKRHILGARRQNCLCDSGWNDELDAALHRAFCRILSWRIPPNWSAHDWSDEVKAITAAAGCLAELQHDSESGVPLSAFLYQRALTCAWTRYRQEWAYARRFIHEDRTKGGEAAAPDNGVLEGYPPNDSLQCALMELPFADQRLIRELFWNKTTENKVAKNLKISQQAVSKRKRKIICKLRRALRDIRATILISGTLVWNAVPWSVEPLVCCDFWL